MNVHAANYLGPLNRAGAGELLRFSTELLAQRTGAPIADWLHVLPDGPDVTARDGRAFRVEDLASVVARSELPLLVDWEHNSELPHGETRAAGWIEALERSSTNGSRFPRAGLWGRVKWTPRGAEDVRARAYRYLSPVVVGKRDDKGMFHVQRVSSVALTNRPALAMNEIAPLRALCSREFEALADDGNPHRVNRAALRAHGFTEAEIREAERDVFGKPSTRVDVAALKQYGLTDTQIAESVRDLYGASG